MWAPLGPFPLPEPEEPAADRVEEQHVGAQREAQLGQAGEPEEALVPVGQGRARHGIEDPDRNAEEPGQDQVPEGGKVKQASLWRVGAKNVVMHPMSAGRAAAPAAP